MIDTRIESEPRFPLGPAICALCGILLVVVSIPTKEVGWIIGSIPCWTVAAALFLVRPRDFSVTITAEGLEHRDIGQLIRYDSIDFIEFQGQTDKTGGYVRKQVPFMVIHDQGTLTIPANINVPSTDLFEFLQSQFEPREVFTLNPLLTEFADEQTETFGADKVFRFTARRNLKSRPRRLAVKAVGAGMMIGAVCWFFAAGLSSGWIGGGIFLGLVGLFTFLASFVSSSSSSAKINNWQNSGLVISPVGLALVQGPLKGRMRWDELRNVKANQKRGSFQLTSAAVMHGILLQIEGSALVIADIYNQPLATIHAHILDYWRGDGPS